MADDWRADRVRSAIEGRNPTGLAELDAAFAVRVVVGGNGATVELPERHRGVEIVRHSGTGDHLGAWDAAWRAGPAYAAYLFVRGECRAVRADWAAAFHRAASQPGVGLVGECLMAL